MNQIQEYLEFRCASANGRTAQDVLPPSMHPETGQQYQWGGSGDWQSLPTMPQSLLGVWQQELKLNADRTCKQAGVDGQYHRLAGCEADVFALFPKVFDHCFDDRTHISRPHFCAGAPRLVQVGISKKF